MYSEAAASIRREAEAGAAAGSVSGEGVARAKVAVVCLG